MSNFISASSFLMYINSWSNDCWIIVLIAPSSLSKDSIKADVFCVDESWSTSCPSWLLMGAIKSGWCCQPFKAVINVANGARWLNFAFTKATVGFVPALANWFAQIKI